jgi:hypothetical protein
MWLHQIVFASDVSQSKSQTHSLDAYNLWRLSTYSVQVQRTVVAPYHTQWHIHVLNRTRDQPLLQTSTWQHSQERERDCPAPGGIRTRNPSKRAAADPYLARTVTGIGPLILLNSSLAGLYWDSLKKRDTNFWKQILLYIFQKRPASKCCLNHD